MSDMTGQRITLISDPTSEFPKNMNTDFKVCLQQPLDLPGTGWEAALVSLSVPNRSIGWRQLGYTSDTIIVVRATAVLENESGVFDDENHYHFIGSLFDYPFGVSSEVELWMRLSTVLHDKILLEMSSLAASQGLRQHYYHKLKWIS